MDTKGKRIWVFGDIHLGDTYEWGIEVGNKFLDYLSDCDFGEKDENEAILLGDLSDRDRNAGDTVRQLAKLGSILTSKFDHVHIITGNHDKKMTRHGSVQNAVFFLELLSPNVTVYEEPCIITTNNGYKCCFLPYMGKNDAECGGILTEWLNNNKEDDVDIVAGHFVVRGDMPVDVGVDKDALPNSKVKCIGHIHERSREYYVGSIWANKVSETKTDFPRAIIGIDSDCKTTLKELPPFIIYDEVTFPDKIETVDDGYVHVYTVRNCNNLTLARNYYPDNYIRAVIRQDDLKTETELDNSPSQIFLYKNDKEALSAMISETGLKVSAELKSYCESLISG